MLRIAALLPLLCIPQNFLHSRYPNILLMDQEHLHRQTYCVHDNYMMSAYRDEISTRPAETDFALRLHVEIKFRPANRDSFLRGI